MNTTETIKLMLKSLELVDEAMPFPVAKAGIQAGKDWLERGREPVAWRWTESNGQHWFDWRTDWTHHDRAKAMGFAIEYAYKD